MLKNTLIKAIEAAADVLRHYFNGSFKITSKEGINNPVTEADLAAEKVIINTIKNEFPDHFILSEEAGEIKMDSEYKWIIDPIDGTFNFANGIPLCCVSIGLEKAGKVIMGAVYNPFMSEFFFAERGYGATLNDKTIHVNQQPDLNKASIVTGFPYVQLDMPNSPLDVFAALIKKGIQVRRLGSGAIDLCWVAAGRYDAFYQHKLEAWDAAAGYLIVEEAGGKVTDYNGDPYSLYQPRIIASNGKVHDALLKCVNGQAF